MNNTAGYRVKNTLRSFLFLISLSLLCLGLYSSRLQAHPAAAHKADKQVKSAKQIRQQMLDISRQLGVTCTYCHQANNYKNSQMRTHKVAEKHLHLTNLLKKKLQNKSKITCYMCHRGKAKPDYKEPRP